LAAEEALSQLFEEEFVGSFGGHDGVVDSRVGVEEVLDVFLEGDVTQPEEEGWRGIRVV
jgi:hypothetical protein